MGRLYFDPLLKDGCKKIPTQEFQQKNSTNNSKDDVENHQLIPFMIADRGQCSFVQKVRNMEEAGVAVGIVIDETDEDIDSIVMSDDGTGAGIRIPSMLISKIDGQKILDFFATATDKELSQVSILADFQSNKHEEDNKVDYDVWYSSNNDLALDFLQDFMKIDKALGEDVRMTPRFVFWECIGCDNETLNQHCYGGGKYCADSGTKLTGR